MDNVEIVGWYTLDARNLERIKRQAEREDGELLILTPKGVAASLSTLPSDLSSDDKSTQSSETKQISKEKNRAPRIKKVNPFDFAIKGKNTQRPIFKGVYHDKGMLVATDTFILIAMKDDYPKELEGAVTFKDGHVTADVKFPDWRAIFDKKSTGEQTKVDITLDKLASYLDKIKADVPKKILTDEDRKASFVVIDFGYGVSSAYNYEYLVKFVNAARYLNAQVSYCSTGGSSWNSLNKKLIAEGTNGKVALLPVKYESEKNYKFNYNIPLNEAGETHFSIAEFSNEEHSSAASQKDAEYFAALESGDMETAQRIVNEAAERAGYSIDSSYQGTSAFNGAAPWGNGYFQTKEERKDAWDNDEFDGDQTLSDYIERGIDAMNLDYIALDPRYYRSADYKRKEAIDNVRNAIRKKSKTITMYRSVPSDVKEGSFRNGDWVTPSRAYAVENARIHGWGDNYNIIEQTVPTDEIWWDGNDIAEWGYGREADYVNDTDFAYRNTENNRKLLDVITRDDDGNIIPPSKRFDATKADTRFSIEEKRLSNGTEAKQPAFDAAMTMLDNAGIPVEMLSDEAMRQMAEKTNALETVSSQDEYQQTVVSSASGAKVINNLDNLAKFLENEPKTKEKTFLGALAKALDAKKHGSNSQYATFETKNGAIVTIRLANHNAATSTFDNHGEDNGISIVISAKENTGINNDGNAHVSEFYYDAIKLRKAEGKPLVEIVKSIKQSLYSGEYRDTTGLAQVEEVNADSVPELMTVYHGSGARNYVIFNEDDAKITDRIEFLRNGDVVYGAAVGGKILLNADRLNPNTPIHEYTHLWDKACQQKNPELWKRGVELMKQTSLWKEVENDPNYAWLNEDGIAGEVHARLTGNHGEETLERMSREAIDDATTEEKSNSVKTVIGKLREWLSDFWHWVKDTMTPWSRAEAEKVSVKDFINMPIADLAKGTRLYDGQYNAEERSIIKKAKSDGTYMKAPNGKPTNLDERQWVQVRTKAFKKWFGDWQKAARIEKLKSSKAIETSGTEIASSGDLKQYKKNALEYGKALRGEYTNKDTGEKISLTGGNSRGGIREILQHDYKDAEHLQSIAAIPQIIEDSIYVDTLPNEDSGKYPGVESFSYYVCGLNIGGRNYTVKAVIANQSNGERYYDHHLSQIEKGQLLSILPTIQKAGTESGNPLSGFKDKRLISILQTDSSKVVDENGEPMVVIHTTPENFTVFKKGERAGLSGKGIYFAVSGEGVPSSGGNTIHAFLNVRNPLTRELISTDKYRSINNGGMARIDADIYDKYPEFDGVMVRRDEITVKDPNQIKSATTNSGEFSTENDDIRFSIVTDKEEIDRLNSEPTIKVYRAMQLVDGKLYPPMSGKVNGKWRDGISVEDLGKVWEKAEENPELADDKGRFVLNKGNGTTLKARYNPYIHTSTTPLNDQFSSAQSRPELVTVEVEIPKSELTSGYKADKAKDRVGKVEWKAGVIQSKLSGTRTVILSRWDKPMRIVPESEVADKIVEMFDGKDVTMPSNVVTPALRAELEKIGVPFVETDNQGRIKAEEQDVVDILSDGTRFRIVGGNSGYVGYSMSKRAAEAKEKGRFPKTQFVKEYRVPASHLDALVEAEIINNDEWHHTSKFGNKTTFYSWSDDVYQQAYNTNKDSINELAKQYNEADSLAKRREIASEIYDVIEHTDEVVAYREQEAKEYEERRNRVKWELTQRRELETQKKNELSHAREVMSGLSDKDEHIRKAANGYWYNADNQVSLQLSDDGRILNIRYPANTDNSQKKGLRILQHSPPSPLTLGRTCRSERTPAEVHILLAAPAQHHHEKVHFQVSLVRCFHPHLAKVRLRVLSKRRFLYFHVLAPGCCLRFVYVIFRAYALYEVEHRFAVHLRQVGITLSKPVVYLAC